MNRGMRTPLLMAAALVAGACSSSTSLVVDGSSTSDAPATSAAPETTLSAAGGIVEPAEGVVVEAVEGSFDSPATISATPAEDGDLPPGVTPLGGAWTMTSDVEPSGPVLVGLPIPVGIDPATVRILRTADDGTRQLLGGFAEGDMYFAATPGFSDFVLVSHSLEDALTLGTGTEDLPIDLGPREDPTGGFKDEYTALVRGERDAPALRSVRVVGPGEVSVGGTAAFSAAGFASIDDRFLEYSWDVHGAGLSITGDVGGRGMVLVEGDAIGRAILTVEVTDPWVGATAFGSMRVFVVDETLTISLLPLGPVSFDDDAEGPVVHAAAEGGTPPYRWAWIWSDGPSGTSEVEAPRIARSPIGSDVTLQVGVTDANGLEAEAAVSIRGMSAASARPAVLLAGPLSGTVGDELVFDVIGWDAGRDEVMGDLSFRLTGAGTVAREGDSLRVTFDEPGIMGIFVEADLLVVAGAAVRIEGESLPAEAALTGLGSQVQAGRAVGFRVEARGGTVDLEATTHTATVLFGDGATQAVEIPATSAAEWAAADVEHTWEEPGVYTVDVEVSVAGGGTATATFEVEVLGERRAVGGFVVYDVEGTEVAENEVILVIDGRDVTFEAYSLRWVMQIMGFTLGEGGETESVPVDCRRTYREVFVESDVSVNRRDRFSGTVTIRQIVKDRGSECPFGGADGQFLRTGDVSGRIRDGVVEMTIVYPETEELGYQTTRTIEAEVVGSGGG